MYKHVKYYPIESYVRASFSRSRCKCIVFSNRKIRFLKTTIEMDTMLMRAVNQEEVIHRWKNNVIEQSYESSHKVHQLFVFNPFGVTASEVGMGVSIGDYPIEMLWTVSPNLRISVARPKVFYDKLVRTSHSPKCPLGTLFVCYTYASMQKCTCP